MSDLKNDKLFNEINRMISLSLSDYLLLYKTRKPKTIFQIRRLFFPSKIRKCNSNIVIKLVYIHFNQFYLIYYSPSFPIDINERVCFFSKLALNVI